MLILDSGLVVTESLNGYALLLVGKTFCCHWAVGQENELDVEGQPVL